MSRWRAGAAFAAAAVAVAVAGCGSKTATDGDTHPATTSTTPLPGQGRPPVTVGDTDIYPEQFVLGTLYEQALAAEGYNVSLNRNIGPVEVRIKALENGSVTVYPEYIGAWDAGVAGYKHGFASAHAAYKAGQHYALRHGMQLLNPTPFSDTGALGVTVAYAIANGLNSIGDLLKVQTMLTIGGPAQFQTGSPGLKQMEQAYGFAAAHFKSLPAGAQYGALAHNTVQAADINTTDGELASGEYTLLADPAHVFGWGNVVPVVSQKTLAREGPAFAATIDEVSALLTLGVIRQLNADVAVLNEDPNKVAQQFLEAHHLVPQ